MIHAPLRIVAVDPLPEKLQEIFLSQIWSGEYRFALQCPQSSREEEAVDLARKADVQSNH